MEVKSAKLALVISILCMYLREVKSQNPDENFTKFQTSVDICNKCSCATFSTLYILNCTAKDFSHTLSNWPEHTNKTLRVTLSYNTITTLLPFPNSNSSVFISLDHCGIKYLEPGLFENMKKVKFVDLSYNQITIEQLSSEKFKGPYNDNKNEPIEITHLNLAYNKIDTLRKTLFEHMPRLQHLNLEGNNFKVIDKITQNALNSLENLEYLNLARNGLKELPDSAFLDSANLIELNLSMNKLMSVPRVLKNFDLLQILILDSNPIYEFSEDTFSGLRNLVDLSLNNLSNIDIIPSNTFAPLRKLIRLHLSNNKNLGIIQPDAFGAKETLSIKEMYMTNNEIVDIPSSLLDWSKLHIFEFNDNPFLCTCNLYNISRNLSRQITRVKNGPYCIGEEEISYRVFSLNKRVCDENYMVNYSFSNIIQRRYSIIKICLITLTLVALTGSIIAVFVCFLKQRKYGFLDQNPLGRSTTVLYNPLSRQPTL